MTEWKLFTGEVPEPPGHLETRPWMNLECQPGWAWRTTMVVDLVRLICRLRPVASIADLGCGDGSLLALLRPLGVPAWGYELGAGDVAEGRRRGLDVRQGDILAGELEYGDLLIATEVLEHLEDPAGFLSSLPGGLLVASSPSKETAGWHNPIHAWAWDLKGYRGLLEGVGWDVAYQTECDGGLNTFANVTGPQAFQAVVAVRP